MQPDVRIKSPFLTQVAQKAATAVYILQSSFQKAQIVTKYLGYFRKKIKFEGPILTEFRIDRMAFGQPEHTC